MRCHTSQLRPRHPARLSNSRLPTSDTNAILLALAPAQIAIMQSTSVPAVVDSNSALLLMPAELLIKAFCLLPSLFDVLALAASCRRLRSVWISNVTTIYSQIAPSTITCEPYARSLLSDSGGPAADAATLSARDMIYLMRNACVVEMAILEFEREVVTKVRCTFYV
jgi:hypothetical protein